MRVFYFNLNRMSRNLAVLVILATAVFLFSMMVKQSMPVTGGGETGKVINRVVTEKKVVTLTFNVVEKTAVDAALQSLVGGQVKATFFVAPALARDNPEIVRRLALKGHELGILFRDGEVKNTALLEQAKQCRELFAGYAGNVPSLVRFAQPAPGDALVDTVYALGYKIVGSGITIDATGGGEQLAPGAILSVPLGPAGEENEKVISRVLRLLSGEGYEPVTLSQLLSYGPGVAR